jgi:hypothetical protein
MRQRIAILGWGSLLWEGGVEFDTRRDDWQLDGPELKLEFSRVSTSRLGALTLVIDKTHGGKNTVAWCLSKRLLPADALADLRCREATQVQNIHSVAASAEIPDDRTARKIWIWAKRKKLDFVVWTGLPSNFEAEVKVPFSPDRGIAYLQQLLPEGKAKAAEYIWRAPEFIITPLRSAMEFEPWFTRPPAAL